MTVVLAVIVGLFFLLAIIGTIIGMVKGEVYSLVSWIAFSGEWMRIVGECFVVVLGSLSSSSSD